MLIESKTGRTYCDYHHVLTPPAQTTQPGFISGNYAAARVAYALSELTFVYGPTESDYFGVEMEDWARTGVKNVFGHDGKHFKMDVKVGAGGYVTSNLTFHERNF